MLEDLQLLHPVAYSCHKNKSIIAHSLKLLWYCKIHDTFSLRTCKRQWVPKEMTDKTTSHAVLLTCIGTGARLGFIQISLPFYIMERWRYVKKVQARAYVRMRFWKSYFTKPNCLSVLNHKPCQSA